MLATANYTLTPEADAALLQVLQSWDARRNDRSFGNARDARNFVDKIIERQSNRLESRRHHGEVIGAAELDEITAADIGAP